MFDLEDSHDADFFRGKRILVTGGAGFVGSHLVKRLLRHGADVFVLEHPNSGLWRIEKELNDINLFCADIADTIKVDETVQIIKPDYVFHLAAYGVDSSMQSCFKAVDVNIKGIVNLLNAVGKNGCEKLISAGSSAEYGDIRKKAHEEMLPAPANIYGSTKACATIISHQIACERGISIATFRPFGIFGEGEERHKFFCDVILTILEDKDVRLTLCEQHRDYCYVENIIDGFISAARNKEIENEIFNIGSGESHPLKYYAEIIFDRLKTDRKPLYGAIPYRKNEMMHTEADISKIKSLLKWEPRISLEEGVKRTVEWFKENKGRYS